MQRQFKSFGLLPLIICLAAVGCGSQAPADPVPVGVAGIEAGATASDGENLSAMVARELKEKGLVTFDSREDVQADSGGELTLTLLPEGAAKVLYHGSQPAISTGTYSIDAENRLRLNFGPDDPWPLMRLTVKEGVMLVNAPEKEDILRLAFEAGVSRDEITDEDVQAAFQAWPLRQTEAAN